MEEDTKSDVSEIQSQRTGSVLSGRDESETGAQDAADAPSDSQPGTYYKSLSFKTAILRTGCDTFLLILVLRNWWCIKDSSPSWLVKKKKFKNTPKKRRGKISVD